MILKRISECVWEEIRNEKEKSKYEFVDFNRKNGLYLFDKQKNIFINIKDKDYSVGKNADDLITVSTGSWQNFNQFGPNSFNLIFKDTVNCQYIKRNRKKGNLNCF